MVARMLARQSPFMLPLVLLLMLPGPNPALVGLGGKQLLTR
jgi:hypothetical protein